MEKEGQKSYNNIKLRTFALAAMAALNLAWSGIFSSNWIKLALGIFGSGSLTLFIFLLEEGYKKTSNLTKYMLRMLGLTLVSAVPYYLVYGNPERLLYSPQNFFSSPLTLFLCLGSIALFDKLKTKQLQIMAVVFLCIVSFIFSFEWCPYALILMFIIHIYDESPKYRDFYIIMFFSTLAIVSAVMYLLGIFKDVSDVILNVSLIGCVWPVPLIRKYDGKLGKRTKLLKLLSYSSYPLMLVTLFLIKFIMSK